ncbi:voltage-gated chloride channel protein [Pedobacter sp. HMF7647]|uniref:Voltage-gated chloride channel protein n=1 Tax=Hufsiella arboris TaxID=2695275 RepID=A0A7K1Y868_9SPHI|nr:chloride channel protein [Hufsiella arboris]MXV50620.1 voltage-gated chloride channel protein [Hufsiella arboris]
MKDQFSIFKQLIRWTIWILPVALVTGSIVSLFLWLLNWAIHFRFSHSWLLFLLPLAGLLIHVIYQSAGKSSEKGNNLIIEQIHQDEGDIPWQMAPIILITTIMTHLFGGSAGREGTAVQIGGSVGSFFGNVFKLNGANRQIILTASVAAGFGAVFGTPLTGAVFAMEVLTIGKIQYRALLPSLMAAIIGDITVSAWHVSHVQYHIDDLPYTPLFISNLFHFDLLLFFKVIIASAVFGFASYLFTMMTHTIKKAGLKFFKTKWMIPVAGGLIIIGLTLLIGAPDYLSLGVNPEYPGAVTISSAFHTGGSHGWSWLWKTLYTSITLGSGFKGGEVTPLFYIGATLGNSLSDLLNAPVSLFAALGFIAVFAGATNTPIACTFMGIELFGGEHAILFATACFTAYYFSGHSGIYGAQRIEIAKFDDPSSIDESISKTMEKKVFRYKQLLKYNKFFKGRQQ